MIHSPAPEISNLMPELAKTTTKQYFACRKCEKKIESVSLGSSTDFLGFGGSGKAYYCDNKECNEYGRLTVVGIKKEE